MTQVISVTPGTEIERLKALQADPAYDIAELDQVMTRQFVPSDPKSREQWHHAKIGTTNAWAVTLGYDPNLAPLVRVAILDTAFQMNHPDLQANTTPGWSMIRNAPILMETNGFYHSTLGAGLAGAVINNGIGVAGIVNCALTPIDIGDRPTISDMRSAILWAADHGIRVVNLSWDGAFSAVLDEAGAYLKTKARGMLFMSGVNGSGFLNYPAHPNIYAVSMTDTNDQARSSYGDHIDFAAPGWDIFSTTTNSSYEADSGTSYSAPLMAGVAAWIMSENPDFGPAEVEDILRTSCVDLGAPGWDQHFGWGRIDLREVARNTFARTPVSRIVSREAGVAEAVYEPGTDYRLYRSASLNPALWEVVSQPALTIEGGTVVLRDPDVTGSSGFYRIEILRPR